MEDALDLIATGEPLPREPQDLSQRTLYRDRDARDGTVDWEFPASRILRFFRAADYGSFDSPRYRPRARCRDRTLLLTNAKPGTSTEASPGEIVSIHSERVEVACGDDRTLIVQIERPDEVDLQLETSSGDHGQKRPVSPPWGPVLAAPAIGLIFKGLKGLKYLCRGIQISLIPGKIDQALSQASVSANKSFDVQ